MEVVFVVSNLGTETTGVMSGVICDVEVILAIM